MQVAHPTPLLPGFWSTRKLHILWLCPSGRRVCRLAMWKFWILLVCTICTWWMSTPLLASLVPLWLSSRIFGSPATTISWKFSCKTVPAFLVPSWCLCQGGHWFFLHLAVTGNIGSKWNSTNKNPNSWLNAVGFGKNTEKWGAPPRSKGMTSCGTSLSSKVSCHSHRWLVQPLQPSLGCWPWRLWKTVMLRYLWQQKPSVSSKSHLYKAL